MDCVLAACQQDSPNAEAPLLLVAAAVVLPERAAAWARALFAVFARPAATLVVSAMPVGVKSTRDTAFRYCLCIELLCLASPMPKMLCGLPAAQPAATIVPPAMLVIPFAQRVQLQ